MNNPSTEHPFYGDVISVYTRAQGPGRRRID